jgi:tetratricopeptide (TPR) repeat protein
MKTKITSLVAALFLTLTGGVALAQNNNRTSAIMAYKSATECMQKQDLACTKKNLLEAKELIDKCSAHEETKNEPKTLYYRGEIYLTLAAVAQMDVTMKEYATEANMQYALDSYKASIANKNKKENWTDEITFKMNMMRMTFLNQGVEFFNKKEYKQSYEMFAGGAVVMDVVGVIDSLAHYNAGLAAERQNKYDTAALHYKKCVEVGYNGADMYNSLISALLQSGQNDEAGKYLAEAGTKYPGNKDLLITEVNYHLKNNNKEAAQKATNKAIEKDPKNPLLHWVVGTIYDELKQYELAEASYKKAIELKPDYFDALYNLGAMYHNNGVERLKEIDNITDNTLYQDEKKKADQKFADALPYLEKCREIDTKDINTMIMMKNCYGRLNMQDKWKEMNDLITNSK